MKRLLFLFAMLLTSFALMAQEVIPSEGPITIDLTTFTGIMAFVTMSATQLAKVVRISTPISGLRSYRL